ncbi:MAG: hypothetical protein IJI98_03495 [Methanosphaera sp.]|nr:hypothetical protein [Methanosphaera sp.]
MTWETLLTYTTFVSTIFMVVEFTKELPFIKKIPTKYWSFLISLGLLIIVNVVMKNFKWEDIVLYALSSMAISLGSNGLSNFNKKGSETNG